MSRRPGPRVSILSAAAAGLLLAGCSVPAKVIRYSYTHYNTTLAYNTSQEMLLNLVRLRYRESPMFLKVGALSTSYDLQVGADASLTRSGEGRAGDVNRLGASGRYSARPTITYTPLEGNTFVKQVLAEVSPDTFVLLVRSGWPMRTLASVMVERIQHRFNDEDEPTYQRFLAAVETLHEAQKRGDVRFVASEDGVYMEVVTDRRNLDDQAGDGGRYVHRIPFTDFQIRSLFDIMFFLAKNTQVPEEHRDQVRDSGMNGWLNIRVSKDRPDDAMVAVPFNGYHYSIAATDIRSKDTFALLKLIFQIQAGDIESVQPVLTLPVATP